jgi:hypothetical protein
MMCGVMSDSDANAMPGPFWYLNVLNFYDSFPYFSLLPCPNTEGPNP